MIEIKEGARTEWPASIVANATYFDHQPGDGTRYEILAVELFKGLHLGRLGYVSQDAIVIVCGMGDGRAYLFQGGDTVSEFYIEEKFGLKNPHTVHHITELVAKAISGTVAGCTHEAVPA